MNKSPIDEVNDNEYTDLEANRQEALDQIDGINESYQMLNETYKESQETQSSSSSETKTPVETKPPEAETENPIEKFSQRVSKGEAVETSPFRKADGTVDQEKISKYGSEGDFAELTGLADFAQGTVNLVTAPFRQLGVPEVPQISKFESKEFQVVRDLSSVILPSLALGGMGVAGGAAAQARWGSKLGKLGKLGDSVAFSRFAKVGVQAGTGALVDYVAPTNAEDDNVAATLKENWPQTWGWISPNWATQDEDSPDIKRLKNMKEGVLLSIAADLIVGASKILSARGKTATGMFVPEVEKATQVTKRLNDAKKAKTPEDVVVESAKKQKEAVDEVGQYNLTKSIDLDKPIFGVSDVYDDLEYGMRTADPGGVLGMAVDSYRINNGIDTVYGRIGSGVTPAALKFATEGDEGASILIQGMVKQMQETGPYGYRFSNGKYASFAEISADGDRLAAELNELNAKDLKLRLSDVSFEHETGVKIVREEAYNAVVKSIKYYLKEFASLDHAKAHAYLANSLSGQVSDMAEGLRLMDGTVAVQRAQEEILDRIQILMAAKGQRSYIDGRALNLKKMWNRRNNFYSRGKDKLRELGILAKAEIEDVPAALKQKAEEAKQTVDVFRAVNKERPELFGPLMLAWEHTDGKINTMTKLNNYINNSTGMFSKLLVDTQSEIPSAWTQGVWANIYNSVLSSVVTPTVAGISNAALIVERPVATFMGAAINGMDRTQMRRALYQYQAFGDSFVKGWKHMNEVWKRATKDPSSVGYIMRDDIARKNEKQLEILNSYADAQSQLGNDGPAAMVAHIEELNALAEFPWLRYGSNAMSALDGFTRSLVGSAEARGRAFDAVNTSGGRLSDDMMDLISENHYKAMFDKNGIISDQAVEYASREISMNLDTGLSQGIGDILRDLPAAKPFMMFPRTSMNVALFNGSHNPLGLLPGIGPAKRFQDSLHKFSRPFEDMAEAEVRTLLDSRGLSYTDETMELVYNNIRAELKGRKALGALAVFTVGSYFLSGNIRGLGHFDKETQRARRDQDWAPITTKGLDGRWYSYDKLGPMSDWASLTATVMDNIMIGTLTPQGGTDLLNKLGFIISASVTSKSFMSQLEPLNDMLSGNPAALARWAASFGSGMAPLSGLRNDFSRLMQPQLKVVEQELGALIANRNPVLKDELYDQYDYIDGGLVGISDNPWTNAFNALSPWKVHDRVSDEKQFLTDIEYDGRPTLNTDGNGVKLTAEQKSAVAQKMGANGYFKDRIQEIMNSYEGKQFRKSYKEALKSDPELKVERWSNLHILLDEALSEAIDLAIDDLSPEMKADINNERARKAMADNAARAGNLEELQKHSTTRYR